VCDEVMGRAALGFASRGFDTAVQPELGLPLAEAGCVSCGQCVTVCPTGALGETQPVEKPTPVEGKVTYSICPYCSVGCGTALESIGGTLLRSLPSGSCVGGGGVRAGSSADKTALLCAKGRFGFAELQRNVGKGEGNAKGVARRGVRVAGAFARVDGELAAIEPADAHELIAKKTRAITVAHGAGALAVAVSDRYTNEEIFTIRRFATEVLKTSNVYCLNGVASGLKDVFGSAASTNTIDELAHTDVIVLFCEDVMNSHTIAGVRIKQAVENGAKLILASNLATQADEWATLKITPGENLGALKTMAKALIGMGKKPANALGFDEYARCLTETAGSDSAVIEAARLYGGAKKAMFVFDQKALTQDAARLVAGIAAIAGHVGKPRSGVVALLPNNNSQGLVDMGVNPDGAALAQAIGERRVKGLYVFGEDASGIRYENLEFLMVSDFLMTETALKADVVLPGAAPTESNGTYTSADRKVQRVRAALLPPLCRFENWQLVLKLADAIYGRASKMDWRAFKYESVEQIWDDIGKSNSGYQGMGYQQIAGGAYTPFGKSRVLHHDGFAFEDGMARLRAPDGDALFTRSRNTNEAYNRFMRYLEAKGLKQ
jgi:formate dehydrogenase major subunit